MDLRCAAKLHGVLDEDTGILEVKCSSRFCGAGPGVVVLHRWDTRNNEPLDTQRFKDPAERTGGK